MILKPISDNLNKAAEDVIPEWHKNIVRQRLEDYKKNKEQAIDFDIAMDDIEKDLLEHAS
jgi:hypothetical protein